MSEAELKVLELLAQAWNTFVSLEVLHHADREEFGRAIHAAQNIVLAREGLRATGVVRLADDGRVDVSYARQVDVESTYLVYCHYCGKPMRHCDFVEHMHTEHDEYLRRPGARLPNEVWRYR